MSLEMFHQLHAAPQGVFRTSNGGGLWRVWAPKAERVTLVTWPEGQRREMAMRPAADGYYEAEQSSCETGLRYAYRLNDEIDLPDPASRWQPEGVHKPSAIFFPEDFSWDDQDWQGVALDELVLYELHIGTFTPEGTFESAIERLPALKELGVTAVELMPISQFPGARNWGYDGVHPYAAQNTYGGPAGLQQFVAAAHEIGLGVHLDVVYNHLGPEGNYLGLFGHYFNDHYHTPWGDAVNFDSAGSDPVRRYVIDNACMWVRDFHLDGLRLDAVHAIYDNEALHVLQELQQHVQQIAAEQNRQVLVIAESNLNNVRLVESPETNGFALDGVWADDFHHCVHALLTGEREGYYRDFGRTADLLKSYRDVFVYDGVYSIHRGKRHGRPTGNTPRQQFVVCIQNHDQVGNRALGERFGQLLSPAAQRLAAGLLLVHPSVPLLFMGEEYGETRAFPFFCDFLDPALVEAVRVGRREEFAKHAFEWTQEPPDAVEPETYENAKLSWSWPPGSTHAGLRQLYRDLLELRRQQPALRQHRGEIHTACYPAEAADDPEQRPVISLQYGPRANHDLVVVANLAEERAPFPPLDLAGLQLRLSTANGEHGGPSAEPAADGPLGPNELRIFCRS